MAHGQPNDAELAFAYEDSAAGLPLNDGLAAMPIWLKSELSPITNMNDVVERMKRAERYRLAARAVYEYVDELDAEMRETGDCGVDPIDIVDEVKRLLSRVHQ